MLKTQLNVKVSSSLKILHPSTQGGSKFKLLDPQDIKCPNGYKKQCDWQTCNKVKCTCQVGKLKIEEVDIEHTLKPIKHESRRMKVENMIARAKKEAMEEELEEMARKAAKEHKEKV